MLQNFLVILIISAVFKNVYLAPKIIKELESNREYANVLFYLNKLSLNKPPLEMRNIATVGIISGVLQTEQNLEDNLTSMVIDLITTSEKDEILMLEKIQKLEDIMDRDLMAVVILGNILDLARRAITPSVYRKSIKRMSDDYERNTNKTLTNDKLNVSERKIRIRKKILSHINTMHEIIADKMQNTINYIKNHIGNAEIMNISTINNTSSKDIVYGNISLLANEINSELIFMDSIENSFSELAKQQNGAMSDFIEMNMTTKTENAKDLENNSKSDEFPSNEEQDRPGGLAGLIASLSGGAEGSDVGALVGALTGLVMNLFGPEGLDIPSLLSTATSLISGLLAGDRDFGTVLGEYVGITVDGLSGGGGAINNGKFFGNFLGTLIAELSADPEEDDKPPKPKVFIETFLNSLLQAKNKTGMGGNNDENRQDQTGGSDSFGFITHIVQAVVGGVTSFILNAFLGSVGGSSQGIGSLSAVSSHPSSNMTSKPAH